MKQDDTKDLRKGCIHALLLYMVLILSLFLCLVFGGCCSCRTIANETNTNEKDSVKVEVKVETVYVKDSVKIYIEKEKEAVIVQDSSHLENSYAKSDARINLDGTLFHSLETKPQEKNVEFDKPIVKKDSIVYRTIRKTMTKTITKEVKRDYTWWDKTRFYIAYVFLAWIAVWLIRKYKGNIISLVARLIA